MWFTQNIGYCHTSFRGGGETIPEKMPTSYMMNFVFLHDSLGLNLMLLRVTLTKNHLKKLIFLLKNTIFRLKTHEILMWKAQLSHLQSAAVSHMKRAFKTSFMRHKFRWPTLLHFFSFKVISLVLITEKAQYTKKLSLAEQFKILKHIGTGRRPTEIGMLTKFFEPLIL